MEIAGFIAVLALGIVLAALVWRPARAHWNTAEEALEGDALRREQEKNLTDATYAGDRFQIRPRR